MMDPVVAVGVAAAAAGTVPCLGSGVAALRQGRAPVVEAAVVVLLVLSVDWTNGQWPTWQVAAVFFCWALLLVTYPDGRLTPQWTLALLVGYGLVLLAGWALVGEFSSGPWPALLLSGLGAAAATQVWRYRRRSTQVERESTQCLLLGLVVTVTVLLVADLLGLTSEPDTTSWWWGALRLVGMVLPLSAAFGLTAPTHSAVSPLLHHLSAAAATVLALACLYRLASPHLSPGTVTAMLVVASPALLLAMHRAIEPLVYGSDSKAPLRRLVDRLHATLGPDDVTRTVEEAVRASLAVPQAVIEFDDRESLEGERFPVTYQGRHVATLVVSPRAAEAALTRRDRAVVRRLSDHAGPALHGARVVRELRTARERLVTAREEERRRIRRDLHDDLGPSLAGLRLTASALRAHLHAMAANTASAQTQQLADELTVGIGQASALVRRVVYDLQPAGLDRRGLVPALQDRLIRPDDDLHIEMTADVGAGELPAAVEVAALRIVTEAVTNARRHAQATVCNVEVKRSTRTLDLTVYDNGHGLQPGTPLGVGLRSIEERAEELGGSSELHSSPAGTTLRVSLPLTTSAGGPAR